MPTSTGVSNTAEGPLPPVDINESPRLELQAQLRDREARIAHII
jgi:hypothetical protein